jgi:hypothetical protein
MKDKHHPASCVHADQKVKKTITPLKAIRAKCMDCSNYQEKEVKHCWAIKCPLWPYRMGRGYEEPSKPGVSVPREEDAANVSDLEEALVET